MALRLSVALGAVLAGWLLIAASWLPPHRAALPIEAPPLDPHLARTRAATVGPHHAVHRLEGMAWLRATAMPLTPDSALWLAVDTTFPDGARQAIREAALAKWRTVGARPAARAIRLGVADAREDPHDAPRLWLWNTHLEVEVPSDRTAGCLVHVAAGDAAVHRASALGRSPLFTLGVCAFYARFGEPGGSIATWLREGGKRLAAEPDWETPFNAPTARAARQELFRARFHGPFGQMPMRVASCLGGDSRACREILVKGTSSDDRNPQWVKGGAALVESARNEEAWTLADLVRGFGAERFDRFWRSDADVPDAFRAAFGREVEEWYRDWARTVYGPLPRGTRQQPVTVLASLGLLAVLVAVGAGLAERREVG